MTNIDPTVDPDFQTAKLPEPGEHVNLNGSLAEHFKSMVKKATHPFGESAAEPAKRYDEGKTPLADFDKYFDAGFAAEIGRAFAYGAQKYGRDNWKAGMSWSRCMNSCRRHLLAFWWGEARDEESGIHHLALAVCSIMFLFAYEQGQIGKDDR